MTIKTSIGNITGTMDVLNEISAAFDYWVYPKE